jgi:hypothetical protein
MIIAIDVPAAPACSLIATRISLPLSKTEEREREREREIREGRGGRETEKGN